MQLFSNIVEKEFQQLKRGDKFCFEQTVTDLQ